ncbi:DUF4192 domain-containing protein [Saccharothrix variisporea]|uniref:Uncharacterized protein DUF4192 n=1 Tax=Saccharothrix variisporea TaxID=543527 RepID=A0A495X7D3_9PSEU|nr:DUF4192 domain-containing protein [Saccharothrix variisporea]RKT69366.1 uncharacterized protein DUF4192 [Saccharothrix variisporea]
MTDDARHDSDQQHSWPSDVVEVNDPGQLIAAIPHLLGFYPTDSIVVLVVKDDHVDCVMRTDCPTDQALYARVAAQLAREVDDPVGARVAVVVVGTPDRDLAGHLRDAFTAADMAVMLFGVPEISHGAPWIDYDHSEPSGILPDPEVSVMAVHTVAKGLVTLPSREALVARITPAPDDVLARRAALLAAARNDQDVEPTADDVMDLVRRYTQRIVDGDERFTDDDIVQACRALTAPEVRNACLLPIESHPEATEKLWLILTRQCPAPASAEAAALLAVSAYIRGDGPFARVALDRALDIDPQHTLARLALDALNRGVRPRNIHQLISSTQNRVL